MEGGRNWFLAYISKSVSEFLLILLILLSYLLDVQHPHGLLYGSVPGSRLTHGAPNAEEYILQRLKKLDKVEQRKSFRTSNLGKVQRSWPLTHCFTLWSRLPFLSTFRCTFKVPLMYFLSTKVLLLQTHCNGIWSSALKG